MYLRSARRRRPPADKSYPRPAAHHKFNGLQSPRPRPPTRITATSTVRPSRHTRHRGCKRHLTVLCANNIFSSYGYSLKQSAAPVCRAIAVDQEVLYTHARARTHIHRPSLQVIILRHFYYVIVILLLLLLLLLSNVAYLIFIHTVHILNTHIVHV